VSGEPPIVAELDASYRAGRDASATPLMHSVCTRYQA
jgi:hypothetical protein